MKEIKAIDALTKIFHIETYTGENGNYELSSNDWGLNFNVRIREYTIFIQDGKGARCSIDSDEDVDTMCQEIVAFIGEVIKDESKNYTFKNRSQILAWPYNCNTNYVDYLKMAFDMNSEEDEFDYAKRKRSVTNSRKSIKSGTDPNVNEDRTFTKEYIMDNPELFTQDVFDKYGISREDLLRKQYNVDSSSKKKWIHPDERAKDEGADITCSRKSVKSSDIRDTRRQRNTKTLTSALEKMF